MNSIDNILHDLDLTAPTDRDNFNSPDVILMTMPGWSVDYPPLNLAILSSIARRENYKVLPLDMNLELSKKSPPEFIGGWDLHKAMKVWDNEEFVEKYIHSQKETFSKILDLIIATKCKLIGFSLFSTNLVVTLSFAKMIKERDPSIVVVCGGPSAQTADIEFMPNCSSVDLYVIGEGDMTFLDILAKKDNLESLKQVPGTFYVEGGRAITSKTRPLIDDLDSLPFAHYHDYDFFQYNSPHTALSAFSRGCPNKCSFCQERVFWKSFRVYGSKRLVDEFIYQKEQHPHLRSILFSDSLINGNIKKLKEFAILHIFSRVKLTWGGHAVIRDKMDLNFFKILKKAQCRGLTYGLETTSKKIMIKNGKLLAKHANVDQIVKDSFLAGLKSNFNFMFGLPGETEEDHQETLNFLRRNASYLYCVRPSPKFCIFPNNTPGLNNSKSLGIELDESNVDYWVSEDGTNTFLVRLRRFEEFCQVAQELNINSSYKVGDLAFRDRMVGDYYYHIKDWGNAQKYYHQWLEKSPSDEECQQRLTKIQNEFSIKA